MEAGLNVLFLDNYDRIKIVDKIQERYDGPYPVYQYPADSQANPHRRRKVSEHDIVVGMDLTLATNGTHAQVSNHAGNAFPLNHEQDGKRCAKPFREMSIRWDGNVAVCCNDWVGWYKCGNVLIHQWKKYGREKHFMQREQNCIMGNVISVLVTVVTIPLCVMDCYLTAWDARHYPSLLRKQRLQSRRR